MCGMNVMTKKFYELAIMKNPGLKESVKVSLHLTKRDLLFLARLIDYGLNADLKKEEDMLALLPVESRDEILKAKEELLKRGDMEEYYQEINSMNPGDGGKG